MNAIRFPFSLRTWALPALLVLNLGLPVQAFAQSQVQAPAPATKPAGQKLSLNGSSTVAPLALEMAKRFEQQNPGVRVDVQSGGSGRGIADARSGVADIGLVSRALKIDATKADALKADALKGEESDLTAHTIALDGVTLITHKSNPVKQLSTQQVVDIYTGAINNWKQVGGKDLAIVVVNKAEGRSTLELFLQYFQLKNSAIKAQVVIGDNQQGIKTVAANPGAIGYVSIGSAEFEEEQGASIQLLPLNGVPATTEAVRTGRFPLSRPLNLVTRGAPVGLADRFIRFARSPQVDDLIREQYFVIPKR